MADPFDPDHLIGHVKDSEYFEVPRTKLTPNGKIHIPQPFTNVPALTIKTGFATAR